MGHAGIMSAFLALASVFAALALWQRHGSRSWDTCDVTNVLVSLARDSAGP